MEFGVTVLLRPEVEGNRGEFIHYGVGQAVLREIDGLNVGVAGVAALHAYMSELVSLIDRKFGLVLLAASGADDAAEFPLAQTETTD